jgi:nicotinate-nucleotide adenylyltransferase
MAVLYFGGSFNPIHHGHLICARAVAEARGYERVVLMPSSLPPHKPDSADLAAPKDRLEMCQLATAGSTLFRVSDQELKRTGPSYTIDTVRELGRAGLGKVHWLIGADMLLYLPKWHQPLELMKEAELIVMARPGWTIDWQTLPPEYQKLQANVVEAPLIEISAGEVRRRVAEGRSIEYLTPPAVCRYIGDRSLYR